jgi:hypothetical protein
VLGAAIIQARVETCATILVHTFLSFASSPVSSFGGTGVIFLRYQFQGHIPSKERMSDE